MKNNYSREWLENYKTIPKRDNAIYKNYQNPGMSTWDRQMASLSSAQRNRYNEFLNTIPNELQGLSAAEMQKYLQEINQKQNALTQEKAGYENQVQNIKNQEAQRQAQLRAQQEAQRQTQLRTNQNTTGIPSGWTEMDWKMLGGGIGPIIWGHINRGQSPHPSVVRTLSQQFPPHPVWNTLGNGPFIKYDIINAAMKDYHRRYGNIKDAPQIKF